MKIIIMGYSGSGKSTLCRNLAEKFSLPTLHLDQVQFMPGWEERKDEQKRELVTDFLDKNDDWIIDGNYFSINLERRLEEADQIILLLFGRLTCLWRCAKRYRTYYGKSRPDMTEGCEEKLDWEFIRWILWEGRSRKIVGRYKAIHKDYPQKTVILKNQKQIDEYICDVYHFHEVN